MGKKQQLWYIQIVEYYSVTKRNELPSREKMSRKFECTSHRARSQSEKAAHCIILTLRRSGRGSAVERWKGPRVARSGKGGGGEWAEHRGFQSSENTGGNSPVVMDHSPFLRTHSTCNTRNDLSVNGGLWVAATCGRRFISCDQRALWWRELMAGKAVCLCAPGAYGQSLCLPFYFAANLKHSKVFKFKKKKKSSLTFSKTTQT